MKHHHHLIIGAAAVAAVGLFLYSRSSKKAPTAAVQPSPMTSSGGITVTATLRDAGARIASAFGLGSTTPAPATTDVGADGDVMTARASDAQNEIAYSLA